MQGQHGQGTENGQHLGGIGFGHHGDGVLGVRQAQMPQCTGLFQLCKGRLKGLVADAGRRHTDARDGPGHGAAGGGLKGEQTRQGTAQGMPRDVEFVVRLGASLLKQCQNLRHDFLVFTRRIIVVGGFAVVFQQVAVKSVVQTNRGVHIKWMWPGTKFNAGVRDKVGGSDGATKRHGNASAAVIHGHGVDEFLVGLFVAKGRQLGLVLGSGGISKRVDPGC